jgi:prepilin peptidase CpaA
VRGFGAGDVKAMAAAGAFLGAESALLAAAFTLMAGGLLGLMVLLRTAGPAAAFYRLLGFAAAPGSFMRGTMDPNTTQPRQRFPYGSAIAVGVLAALLWSGRLSLLSGVSLDVN